MSTHHLVRLYSWGFTLVPVYAPLGDNVFPDPVHYHCMPFPEIWHPMPNPVDASQKSARHSRPVLRPLHVRLSSPGNSRRACTPNPAWFSLDSACSVTLPAACDRNYLLYSSHNSRDKRSWIYMFFFHESACQGSPYRILFRQDSAVILPSVPGIAPAHTIRVVPWLPILIYGAYSPGNSEGSRVLWKILPYLIEPLLRPDVPGYLGELSGGCNPGVPGTLPPLDPLVVGAQLRGSHHGRSYCLYEGPPEILVTSLRQLPVECLLPG